MCIFSEICYYISSIPRQKLNYFVGMYTFKILTDIAKLSSIDVDIWERLFPYTLNQYPELLSFLIFINLIGKKLSNYSFKWVTLSVLCLRGIHSGVFFFHELSVHIHCPFFLLGFYCYFLFTYKSFLYIKKARIIIWATDTVSWFVICI